MPFPLVTACRVCAMADTDNNRLVVFSVTVTQHAAQLGPAPCLHHARTHGSGAGVPPHEAAPQCQGPSF